MAHWDNQARQWALIGEPLKPSIIDLENTTRWMKDHFHSSNTAPNALVLGVTPEIIHLPWPQQTRLFAVDYSEAMIQSVLPKETSTLAPIGLLANWLNLPFPSSSIDLVIGDGSFSQLSWKDYGVLAREIQRVLKPGGLLIVRCFIQSDTPDSIELIRQDLFSGKIASFHAFKLRLLTALYSEPQQSVCLKNVWDVWDKSFKSDILNHKEHLNWHLDTISTIDTYRLSNACYTFPKIKDIRMVFSNGFIEKDCFFPQYYFGQQCPTLKLSKT